MHLPYGYHGAPRRIVAPPVLVSSSLPITFYYEFLKGKPLILGILMIVAAVIQIALGIWIFFAPSLFFLVSGIMCFFSIFYIITGSLMIAGARKPSICLVNSSLILNILTSVISCIALVLACLDVAFFINYYNPYYITRYYENVHLPLSMSLINNLLLLCISITSAVFAGRSTKLVPSIPQACQNQGTEMVSGAPPAPAPAPSPSPQHMMP